MFRRGRSKHFFRRFRPGKLGCHSVFGSAKGVANFEWVKKNHRSSRKASLETKEIFKKTYLRNQNPVLTWLTQNYVRKYKGGYPQLFMARGLSLTNLHLAGFNCGSFVLSSWTKNIGPVEKTSLNSQREPKTHLPGVSMTRNKNGSLGSLTHHFYFGSLGKL